MKKILGLVIIALLGLSVPSFAQSKADKAANGVKKGASKAWQGTKKGAKKLVIKQLKSPKKVWQELLIKNRING